jgi:hypothetical protein
MPQTLPAITGPQLGRLLTEDGWSPARRGEHGQLYFKWVDGVKLTTTVPLKKKPIPGKTLGDILGPKQTGLGKPGLHKLIEKYGLK